MVTKAAFTVLLEGVVGSTAYGLAGPHSDVDKIAVGVLPGEVLLGLDEYKESDVTTDPDYTVHEARKFCRLALTCNPTATELLWLDQYEQTSPHGMALIGIRSAFLSAEYVRKAYVGYATQQFRRLVDRGDGSFSSDTRKRTAKHARHMMRLVMQGYRLYSTGELTVRVADPGALIDFGERVADGDLDLAQKKLAYYTDLMDGAVTVLPAQPDKDAVLAWLLQTRRDLIGWA